MRLAPLDPERHEEAAQLFHAVWHETHAALQHPDVARYRDLDFFRERISQRAARTVVALVEDRMSGFACWTGATLNSLFVAPDHRSTGIGAALLAVMEQRMQAGGATTFDLICVEGNAAGRRFYERHGWRLSHCDVKANAVAGGTAPVATWVMMKP